MSRRCTAATTAGAPCKAWAVKGTDPPRCATHAGLTVGAGAPPGNANAVRHGFYRRRFTNQELADLVANLDNLTTIDDEIAIIRILLSRLLEALNDPELTTRSLVALAPRVVQSAQAVANLLRARRAISGDAADGLLGALGLALDEIANEWGIDI